MVVGRQVRDTNNKRNDFLFVDGEGSLVLVEVKRDLADIKSRTEALEFQAIRYAASLATIKTPEELITKTLINYIKKYEGEPEGERTIEEIARKRLFSFFRKNNISTYNFNRKQKIRLISSSYDETTLSACAWLINSGIDMKLIQLTPLELDDIKSIQIDVVLTQNKNEDYYVEIEEGIDSDIRKKKTSIERKVLPKMEDLFKWGIIEPGVVLYLKGYENSNAIAIDYRSVEYKGKQMSYVEWGTLLTGWISIQIYKYAYLKMNNESLDDLRIKKMNE